MQDSKDNMNFDLIVLGPRDFKDSPGGIETHCKKMYECFESVGSRFNILMVHCSRSSGGITISNKSKNYSSINIKGSAIKVFDKLFYSLRSTSLILNLRPKLVHMHGFSVIWIAPVLRLFKIPIITTIHSREYNNPGKGWLVRLIARLAKTLTSIFSEIIVISLDAQEEFLGARFIPNGMDRPIVNDSDRLWRNKKLEELQIKHSYIVCLGRVVGEKGIDILIQELAESKIYMPVIIIGAHDEKSSYKKNLMGKVSSDYAEYIHFLGPLPHPTCMAFLEGAALYISASSLEEWGIAPREAMALNIPMVLSDIEAHRSLLLPNDCYYKFGSFDCLAEKIRKVLSSDFCNAIEYSVPQSWADCAKSTMDAYDEVLDKKLDKL